MDKSRTKNTLEHITSYLEKGNVSKALDELIAVEERLKIGKESGVSLKARYYSVKGKYAKGVISYEEFDKVESQIIEGILIGTKNVEENEYTFFGEKSRNKVKKRKGNLTIFSLLILSILVLFFFWKKSEFWINDTLISQIDQMNSYEQDWWNGLSQNWKEYFMKNNNMNTVPNNLEIRNLWSETLIDCSYHKIENLRPLEKFKGLHTLFCEESGITEMRILSKLSALYKIDISNNEIEDLSVLSEMPGLRYVRCKGIQISSSDMAKIIKKNPRIEFKIN